MTLNPILDELYAIRQQILAECNGDLAAYLREAQARLEASGRPVAQLKQKKIQRSTAINMTSLPTENQPGPSLNQ